VLDVGETFIAAVVALVFQEYVVAPLAVNVAVPPVQMFVDVELTFKFGVLLVIVTVFVSLQLPLTPVTVYVVVTVGDTAIDEVVAVVFQEYVAAPLADSVTVEPEQIVEDVALTFTLGVVFVMVTVFVLLQLPLTPVTVYVVVTVGETTILFVVALVFHE
jgi:hypothetical protein